MKHILSIIFICLALNAAANTYTVTNTNDSGSGSLRDALTSANSAAGSHSIVFNIPTTDPGYNSSTGVWTISLATAFSFITHSDITIDGTTQTTAQGNTNPLGPEIMLVRSVSTVDYAFTIYNVSHITIKGFIMSGFYYGVQIYGTNAKYNTISGNYIGTNCTASDSLGNFIGVEIIGGPKYNTVGGTTVADRNIVSANEHIGIRVVNADSNYVIGNYVGTDRTGMQAIGNYDGVSVEGSASYNFIEKNVISGNVAYGIPFIGNTVTHNRVMGNMLGVNVNGTAALPNTYGVLFDDGSNSNVVGTSNAADRNIISGNSGYGIFIYNYGTRDNIVEGNYIGTDITGTLAIPNANGIVIDGAPRHHLVKNNVISGNSQEGIVIHMTYSDNHIIVGNKIGTDYTGLNPLGNGTDGIRLAENVHENIIGGSAADANIIAYNAKCGVNVMTADSWNNSIRCNSIYNNGMLGIDLYPEGVNMNDAGDGDAGANNMMNFPVIDSVSYVSGNARLFGHLDTQLPQYCLVDIYKVNADISGYGEGMIYLGTTIPDAMGNWSDTVVSLNNEYFTATATDSARNTSEFSLIFPEYPFAVNDNALKNISVQISPNPFREKTLVTIESSATKINSFSAELFSSSGTMIKKYSSSDCSSVMIDGSSLPSGTYFLKIKINNKLYKSLKLIRQ